MNRIRESFVCEQIFWHLWRMYTYEDSQQRFISETRK